MTSSCGGGAGEGVGCCAVTEVNAAITSVAAYKDSTLMDTYAPFGLRELSGSVFKADRETRR